MEQDGESSIHREVEPLTSQPSRHHYDCHRARQDLRDRADKRQRIRLRRIRILRGHEYFRTGPRRRIATEEQRPPPRAHLTIRVAHADLSLFSQPRESAGGAEVVLESCAAAIEHTPRRVHRSHYTNTGLILRNPDRITWLQNDVVTRAMVSQRLR